MYKCTIIILAIFINSCSFVERKPEVVQVNQPDESKVREDWTKMMSGIKLETEQAINLAVLKVESSESRGPKLPNGLVIDGEALLVPNKLMNLTHSPTREDWEMTIGTSQLIEVVEHKHINFFVFCFKKPLCPLLSERLITLGVSPKRLNVKHVQSKTFGQEFSRWLVTHPKHLFIGDNPVDIKRVLSKIRKRNYPKTLNKNWFSRFYISLPNAQGRVAKWHNFSNKTP